MTEIESDAKKKERKSGDQGARSAERDIAFECPLARHHDPFLLAPSCSAHPHLAPHHGLCAYLLPLYDDAENDRGG